MPSAEDHNTLPELLQFPYLGACPKDFTLQVVRKLLLPCHPCDERIPGGSPVPSGRSETSAGLAWSFLCLPESGSPCPQLWILTRTCCCPEGRGSSVPGLWCPFPRHVEGTGDKTNTAALSLPLSSKGSPIHRAQIPPS